ncbi:MAG: hypothetical protein ACLU9S_03595 [Oscillospiraceae bacterium]
MNSQELSGVWPEVDVEPTLSGCSRSYLRREGSVLFLNWLFHVLCESPCEAVWMHRHRRRRGHDRRPGGQRQSPRALVK